MNTLSETTIINQFDPELLKTGTSTEKSEQLINWTKGENNSIFVRWVPNEMLPDATGNDSVARKFFMQFGDVNRLDFVPKYNEQGKQSGHMVFAHYNVFNTYYPGLDEIAIAYPNAVEFEWATPVNRYGTNKAYKIKCCVNTRPIIKVEFNASQLTDMIHNITAKLILESDTKDKLIEGLRADNAQLRVHMDSLNARLDAFINMYSAALGGALV